MSKEIRSVVFKNFTDEEFVCSWDSVPYRFAPGKEMYVEDWKADHFAKHLVDKVMNKKGLITTNMVDRLVFLQQALPEEKSITLEEALDVEATAEAVEKKKSKKVVTEEEFAGLNNE